jgi:heparanase 1
VALLAINNDKSATRMLTVPVPGERYTLASDELQAKAVRLNGVELKLGANDALPDLTAAPTQAGDMSLGPATITFIALPGAGNQACLLRHRGMTTGCAERLKLLYESERVPEFR